jgi:hypothetical protein
VLALLRQYRQKVGFNICIVGDFEFLSDIFHQEGKFIDNSNNGTSATCGMIEGGKTTQ